MAGKKMPPKLEIETKEPKLDMLTLRIRSAEMAALMKAAKDQGAPRSTVVAAILRAWLKGNGYLS